MNIEGKMIIGQKYVQGSKKEFHGINPITGESLEPAYWGGGEEEVRRACLLAEQAFDAYRETSPQVRGDFLEQIARNLASNSNLIIERAGLETGLPKIRLEGELVRTMNQLKLFSEELRSGRWLGLKIDTAIPDRTPFPRSDIRLRHIPLGPVAVFGASNFPLAFSVAGGDTASALAAGCPVIVKGHSAHPGTSELVGRAIQSAVEMCGMPEGTFSLLFGSGSEIGSQLASDLRIKAVGFTGSRTGGMALMKIAANRPEPVPVYAEMSSINPVYLFPEALKNRTESIAAGFVNSLLMGSGQFCTNPGLLIVKEDIEIDVFIKKVSDLIAETVPTTMLTSGIHQAYNYGIAKLKKNSNVKLLAKAQDPKGLNQCCAHIFSSSAQEFLKDDSLREEVFGPSSVLIRCRNDEEILEVTKSLEGQLTATILMDKNDDQLFIQKLITSLERKVGRILFNGYPTGVEVCHAMVHGGPFPATSDSRATSVGTEAIWRFLRPVCYQDVPADLLPEELKDDCDWKTPKLINGE
jgi:NADP-dependent aldehyde dehydrogenase